MRCLNPLGGYMVIKGSYLVHLAELYILLAMPEVEYSCVNDMITSNVFLG